MSLGSVFPKSHGYFTPIDRPMDFKRSESNPEALIKPNLKELLSASDVNMKSS